MSDQDQLERLVQTWRTRWLQDDETLPEAICCNDPELLDEFLRRIKEIMILDELVGEYEDLCEQGHSPSPVDVCREHPHLVDPLKKEIEQINRFDRAFGNDVDESIHDEARVGRFCDGRYRIDGIVNRGGQGVIFSARDNELGRTVAIKGPGRRGMGRESLRRLEQEANITGWLEHPGVVPVYGFGFDENGKPFYAMKFIEDDKTLLSAIERYHAGDVSGSDPGRRTLEFRKLLGDFILVCRTIAYAHSRRILHRDIKPANIMLGNFGEVWVVDWGLAKRLDADESKSGEGTSATGPASVLHKHDFSPALWKNPWVSQTHSVRGTLAYMSPEQAGGGTSSIGRASDNFSLGATLYQMLTARAPIVGATPDETIDFINARGIVNPVRANNTVPPPLGAIAMKAMQIKPEDRYANAADIADDVERWLADEPVTAWQEPIGVRTRRWLRRHRTLAASVAVALVVVLGALVMANFFQANLNQRLQKSLAESRRQTYLSNVTLADNYLIEGNGIRARQLLVESPEEYRNWEWRYLSNRAKPSMASVSVSEVPGEIAWRSGNDQFVTVSSGTVRIWNAADGRMIEERQLHQGEYKASALSSNGQRAAFLVTDKPTETFVYDTVTGKLISSIPEPRGVADDVVLTHDGRYMALSFEPQGREFSLDANNNLIMNEREPKIPGVVIFDVDSGREVMTLDDGFSDEQTGVPLICETRFSHDGSRLMVRGTFNAAESCVAVFEIKTGKCLLALPPQRHGLDMWPCVDIHKEGKLIAVAGSGFGTDGALVKVWDVEKGTLVTTLDGHTDIVTSLAFDHDGDRLASSSRESILVWDLASRRQVTRLLGYNDSINAMCFSEDDRELISVSTRDVRLWSTAVNGVRSIVAPNATFADNVVFLPDSSSFATTTFIDEKLHLRDPATGQEIDSPIPKTLRRPAFGPEGRFVALADGNEVLICDPIGKILKSLTGHTEPVSCVVVSPNGKCLASASSDEKVMIWNVETGRLLHTLVDHRSDVMCLSFSRDGRRLVSGDRDGQIRIWNVESGTAVTNWQAHDDGRITVVAYSPDGKMLVSGSMMPNGSKGEGTLKLWNADTGAPIVALTGHTGGISDAAFSPDSQRLASASDDRLVKIWDASTGREIITLRGHQHPINSLAFSPDGYFLVSAGGELYGELIEEPGDLFARNSRGTAEIRIWDGRPITSEETSDRTER